MERISNIDGLLKFEKERTEETVRLGFMNPEDAHEWLTSFNEEAKKFWNEHNVAMMFVLEDEEMEDEEYALVSTGGAEFKMMYMSCRCNIVRFIM